MSSTKNRSQARQPGIEIPDFRYDVKSTFIPIENERVKRSKQLKGLLESCYIRQARNSTNGDVRMRIFSTHTYPTHSDLARRADCYPQPIIDLNWKGTQYVIAGRFTMNPGRFGPINSTIMLDSPEGDVREQRGYDTLRQVVGLALMTSLFYNSKDAEVNSTSMELKVVNNFTSGGLPAFDDFAAENIVNLADKLRP